MKLTQKLFLGCFTFFLFFLPFSISYAQHEKWNKLMIQTINKECEKKATDFRRVSTIEPSIITLYCRSLYFSGIKALRERINLNLPQGDITTLETQNIYRAAILKKLFDDQKFIQSAEELVVFFKPNKAGTDLAQYISESVADTYLFDDLGAPYHTENGELIYLKDF